MHVELTPAESKHIRNLVTKASVFGDRWPVEHRMALFADTPPLEGWKGEKKDVEKLGQIHIDQQ